MELSPDLVFHYFQLADNVADYIYALNNDAGRSLMGGRQENWFYQSLIESKTRGATWRIIGSQIVFSRINTTSWFGTCKHSFQTDKYLTRPSLQYSTNF
jgi:phosphodiesterase/alkaline phosphatase D-like protein